MGINRETFKKFPHKNAADRAHWDYVHPNLLLIADFYIQFALEHELPIMFTRIFSKKIPGHSVSDAHGDSGIFTMEDGTKFKWKGRAFDARVFNWPEMMRDRFKNECNERLIVGAISFSDGKEREVVYETTTGTAPHFHCQCRP